MINVNNTLIAGGYYKGGKLWNKTASNLDKCFKIYHIDKGTAFLYTGGKKHELKQGEIYFVNGYQIERQHCETSFAVNWLHFMSDSIFIKQALLHFPLVTRLNGFGRKELMEEITLFNDYFSAFSPTDRSIKPQVLSSYFRIQALVLKVISLLVEVSGQGAFQLSAQGGRLLKAIEFIDANYKSGITLKQLAGLCFMSENYFHTLFKKEFTVTPNNYILQLRMNEALNLLSNTILTAKEVARECGYPDAAYFSRTFSKYFGLSPSKYRSLHRVRIP